MLANVETSNLISDQITFKGQAQEPVVINTSEFCITYRDRSEKFELYIYIFFPFHLKKTKQK